MNIFKTTLLAGMTTLLAAFPAIAETVAAMTVFKVVVTTETIDGEEKEIRTLVPATSSVPGDEMVYRITLENTAQEEALDVSLTLPIDPAVTLKPGSSTGDTSFVETYSIDNGNTFGPMTSLFVKEENGQRPATEQDLTNIRFVIASLNAAAIANVEYSVTVD